MRTFYTSLVVCFVALSCSCVSYGQEPGEMVRLSSNNPKGVPVHPAAGVGSYVRWVNGTIATVKGIDTSTGWIEISSSGKSGWVTKQYITVISDESDEEPSEESESLSYIVGTWNLEHFRYGAARGFPEWGYGGRTYPGRDDENIENVARIIETQLAANLLVLCEVGGRKNTTKSDELDSLVSILGNDWSYELSKSGSSQRVAILYDSSKFRKGACTEFIVAETIEQKKDIFDRDPLACMFTCLDEDGNEKNDFIVVGVHLASGQYNNRNHDEAMKVLRERLSGSLTDGTFPQGEKDILIMGDFNANRYDSKQENFWTNYKINGIPFVTLSPEDGEDYYGTRLAGVPLFPKSKIDYLLCTGGNEGMTASLLQLIAHVHTELLIVGFDEFREQASDHIPVTVRVSVEDDDD